MKNLLVPLFCFISFISSAQTKLTIQSPNEKCATVYGGDAENVAFGDQGFWAARGGIGKNGAFISIRSFLQFDLSSIPKGSFINWARLTLFNEGSGGPNEALLRRITSQWDPSKVTWNTQPTTAKRATIRLPKSKTTFEDYKNINVTNLLQVMVDSPSTSFGFSLRLDSDAQGNISKSLYFISPSFGEPHKNPKLVLEYTTRGMQPAVTSTSLDVSGATEMTIYPNPCNKEFSCNIKSSAGSMNLRVIDMLGRTVYSLLLPGSNSQSRIELPESSVGTYFVILQDNNGATIVSQEMQVN